MNDPYLDQLLDAWLELGPSAAPNRVGAAANLESRNTQQSVVLLGWLLQKLPILSSIAVRFGLATAVVLAVTVVMISLLPRSSRGVGRPASPTPSASAEQWPTGAFAVGRHDASLAGASFSFKVPAPGWGSTRFSGMVEKGRYATASYGWIGFMQTLDGVATDPCAAEKRTVGPSVADLADAMTTIRGTDAVGPTDVQVGGLPAKLVVLTIHANIPCNTNSFWLYGPDSAYPNSLESTIRVWIFEVHGTRYVIHSDQARPNAALANEIQQIIDSIRFE